MRLTELFRPKVHKRMLTNPLRQWCQNVYASHCTWIASGHFQLASTMKKRSSSVDGAAVGYSWLIKHTKMHQLTPPK